MRMREAKYSLEDFELYQEARQFRRRVYMLIRQLPLAERRCLDPQMRRASVSITNNIAEGHGRWHYLENMHFCRISRGSTEEVIDDINVCLDESYGNAEYNQSLKQDGFELVKKINGYIAYLQRSKQGSNSKGAMTLREPLTTHYSLMTYEELDDQA